MRFALRLVVALVVTMGLLTGTSVRAVSDPQDRISKIDKLFDDLWPATHSDFAFWGNYAFLGLVHRDHRRRAHLRHPNPASPTKVKEFPATEPERPGRLGPERNGVADLMLLAVDRPWTARPATPRCRCRGGPLDANPQGWRASASSR